MVETQNMRRLTYGIVLATGEHPTRVGKGCLLPGPLPLKGSQTKIITLCGDALTCKGILTERERIMRLTSIGQIKLVPNADPIIPPRKVIFP